MTSQTSPLLQPNKLLTKLPFAFASLFMLAGVFLIIRKVSAQTGGAFSYPLDDPYIHMQIAKNIVLSGTWGINEGEFGSASSSLLYTILLTISFKLFSFNIFIPLVINIIAAISLLFVIHRWLQKQQISLLAEFIILTMIVVFGPLPVIIMNGMEHVLQALFVFMYLASFADWYYEQGNRSARKIPVALIILAALVVAVRYEGLFVVFGTCLILLFSKRIVPAFVLGGAAFLPVIIFGVYSVMKGSYFLPNSVLIKADSLELSVKGIMQFVQHNLVGKLTIVNTDNFPVGAPRPGISLLSTQRLLIILPLAFLFYRFSGEQRRSYGQLLLLLLLTSFLHLCLAATGWLYRYEAYLLIAAIAIIGALLARNIRSISWKGFNQLAVKLCVAMLVFALFFPWVLRSTAAYSKISQACINIHDQQNQMGKFIREYYPEKTIALNDIGAVAFYGNARIIDLWGLGNIDVARSKKGKYWTPEFLDSLVRQQKTDIALVYDEWFDAELLKRWTKVGAWKIPNNVICGSDVVNFYAIEPAAAADLRSRLKAFQSQLPSYVEVKWY
ncbi:MAG: hypothetical protein J7527_00935 [Chitinophagaceae bacterium]|nr:hypothetical protein [Chitinophagaceae bacterium]